MNNKLLVGTVGRVSVIARVSLLPPAKNLPFKYTAMNWKKSDGGNLIESIWLASWVLSLRLLDRNTQARGLEGGFIWCISTSTTAKSYSTTNEPPPPRSQGS